MNKYIKKLQDKLNKMSIDQDSLEWFNDEETASIYRWKFQLDDVVTCMDLNKSSGKIQVYSI